MRLMGSHIRHRSLMHSYVYLVYLSPSSTPSVEIIYVTYLTHRSLTVPLT